MISYLGSKQWKSLNVVFTAFITIIGTMNWAFAFFYLLLAPEEYATHFGEGRLGYERSRFLLAVMYIGVVLLWGKYLEALIKRYAQ